jgi:hypothetical protein
MHVPGRTSKEWKEGEGKPHQQEELYYHWLLNSCSFFSHASQKAEMTTLFFLVALED